MARGAMAKTPPRGALGEAGKGSLGREACEGPLWASPEGSGPGLGGSHYEGVMEVPS